MVEQAANKEFDICPHIKEVKSYCTQCKVFTCDQCSLEHLQHIDNLVIWEEIAKKYLKKTENCYNIARLLLVENISLDSIKAEINDKIDAAFNQLAEKIYIYKTQMKEEMIEKIIAEQRKFPGEEAKIPEIFRKNVEDLEIHVQEMKKHKKSGDKETLIYCLQQNFLQEIEKQIKIHQEIKISNQEFTNELRYFDIREDINYKDFLQGLKITFPPFIERNMTQKYKFPEGSRIWHKTEESQKAICCSEQLPPQFKIKICVNNNPGFQNFALGVCQTTFQNMSKCYPWLPNQIGYNGRNGNIYRLNKPTISGNKSFKENGKIISLIYDKHKTLSFEINEEKQPKQIHNLEGPLYFWASQYRDNSEIEILEVIKL